MCIAPSFKDDIGSDAVMLATVCAATLVLTRVAFLLCLPFTRRGIIEWQVWVV